MANKNAPFTTIVLTEELIVDYEAKTITPLSTIKFNYSNDALLAALKYACRTEIGMLYPPPYVETEAVNLGPYEVPVKWWLKDDWQIREFAWGNIRAFTI